MPIRGVIGRAARAIIAMATVLGVIGAGHAAVGRIAAADLHRGTIGSFIEAAAHPTGHGVYLLDVVGGVHTHGEAVYRGSLPERGVHAEASDLVITPNGHGYWIFARDGGVHAFGDAPYLGSPAESRGPGAPVIAATATPTGRGYVALDAVGGIFTFGDAEFLGSVPGLRNAGVAIGPAPAIDVAIAPSGGYYVLDGEGGIFTFGNAPFLGSIPSLRAGGTPIGSADVRDLVVSGDGRGYWATDAAGGLFTFGAVAFHGSAPAIGRPFSLASTAVIPDGSGYWMMDPAGALLAFGAAGSPGPVGDAHAFIERLADGSPVRFNPCRAIPYAVHTGSGAPGNAPALAAEAFARISKATGLTFVDRGATSETFSARFERPKWNHPSYGSGPSPMLVSFEAPNSRNGLGSGDAGIAARQMEFNSKGQKVVVSAAVAVSTAGDLPADFSNAGSYGAVLLHELGHALGLDHVGDTRQIMSDVLMRGNPGNYQGGDLRGLAAIGTASGCLEEPAPR